MVSCCYGVNQAFVLITILLTIEDRDESLLFSWGSRNKVHLFLLFKKTKMWRSEDKLTI